MSDRQWRTAAAWLSLHAFFTIVSWYHTAPILPFGERHSQDAYQAVWLFFPLPDLMWSRLWFYMLLLVDMAAWLEWALSERSRVLKLSLLANAIALPLFGLTHLQLWSSYHAMHAVLCIALLANRLQPVLTAWCLAAVLQMSASGWWLTGEAYRAQFGVPQGIGAVLAIAQTLWMLSQQPLAFLSLWLAWTPTGSNDPRQYEMAPLLAAGLLWLAPAKPRYALFALLLLPLVSPWPLRLSWLDPPISAQAEYTLTSGDLKLVIRAERTPQAGWQAAGTTRVTTTLYHGESIVEERTRPQERIVFQRRPVLSSSRLRRASDGLWAYPWMHESWAREAEANGEQVTGIVNVTGTTIWSR